MGKKISIFILSLLIACILLESPLFGDHFPLRKKYPDLNHITTLDLKTVFNDVIIIDARSRMEFDVIHMTGAVNILVGKMKEKDLLKLRGKDGKKLMVFYCNGHTCSKSYKATKKAGEFGFQNIRVYDAGIFDWAKAHPEKTIFMGKQLSKEAVKTKLIQKSDFLKLNIGTEEFLNKYNSGMFTTLDIRDVNEKLENPIKLQKVKQMDLNTIKKLIKIKNGPLPMKNILVFDNVGKQTRWLQYYFEKYNRSDYHFLKGGVRQWIKDGYSAEGIKE